MPGVVLNDRHDAKHVFQGFRDELGELIFVGCDCEPNDAVSAGKSFRDIQAEEACDRRIKHDVPRNWSRTRMWERGPKLVSSDERLVVDFNLGKSAVLGDVGSFDGGEHLVVGPQFLGQDPIWCGSAHFVPADSPSVVNIPVPRVTKDAMAGGHAHGKHPVGPHFKKMPAERSARSPEDPLEPPSMGQHLISLIKVSDWDGPASCGDQGIWMETESGCGDDAFDLSLLELGLHKGALIVR